MTKFYISTYEFPSKGAAKKAFSDMLKRYRVGGTANPEDHALLMAMVETHPWRNNMLRGGVDHFEVFSHKVFKRQLFWKLVRLDGSSVSIGLTRFFSTRNDDKAARFRERARIAIKPQLDRFRRDCFLDRDTVICPLSGREFGIAQSHVDHVVPFEDMVVEWEAITEEDYSPKSLKAFVEWHRQHALLRCTDATANLMRGRGRDGN